jgi:small ligand-binding sensory domain FIST
MEARCTASLGRGLDSSVPATVRMALDHLGIVPTLAIVEVCAPDAPLLAGRALAHAGELLAEEAPDCTVIGSSAHGVIAGPNSVELEPAISVWLAHLPGVEPRPFRLATVPGLHGGLAITGLPELLEDDRLALLLADPWTLPADDIVASFTRGGQPLPVVGGLVSGGQRRGDSRLLLGNTVFDSGGVGIVLDQTSPVRVVVSQGCRPIGDAMTVTAAEGTLVRELAGRPALERIREVISTLDEADQALAVRGLHVGIARDDHVDGSSAADFVIRGLLGVDGATGSIVVGDEVPVGALVCLHLRDADSADADLRSTVQAADEGGEPAGAYLVTCNGRGGAMFTTSDHDGALVRTGLGTDAVGGFFAAGEIGPVGGSNHLHGFTAVILIVDRHADPGSTAEVARPASAESMIDETRLDAELRSLLDPSS